MKQYFIDKSGSMDNVLIISALNSIGYECLNCDEASIHFIDLGQKHLSWTTIRNRCSDYGEMILYTDGLVNQDIMNLFDKVVIVK